MSVGLLSWAAFLLLAGAIGGADVLYFHVYRFRLYSRPASRVETAIHLGQGAAFILVCLGAAAGWPRPAIMLFFGLHFGFVAVDSWIEKRSRAALGGLPPLEYLFHVAGGTACGGAFGAFVVKPDGGLTGGAMRAVLAGVAIVGGLVSTTELALWINARRRAGRPTVRAALEVDAGPSLPKVEVRG